MLIKTYQDPLGGFDQARSCGPIDPGGLVDPGGGTAGHDGPDRAIASPGKRVSW